MPAEKVVAFVLGYAPTHRWFKQAAWFRVTHASLPHKRAQGSIRPAMLGRIIAEPGQCRQRGSHRERRRGPHHTPVRLDNRNGREG